VFYGKIWRIIPGLDFVDFSTIAHHNLEINRTNQNCWLTDPKKLGHFYEEEKMLSALKRGLIEFKKFGPRKSNIIVKWNYK